MEGAETNNLLKSLEESTDVSNAGELRIIERCSQIALGSLSGAFKALMEKAVDDFFQLAEKSVERSMQELYLEAMGLARDKSASIEESFRTHLFDGFQAAIHLRKEAARKKTADDDLGFDQFSLVDPDDLEESIATQEMVSKLKGGCKEELAGLEKRMGALLHDPEFQRFSNPFDPKVFVDAFMAACRDTEATIKIRLLFVTMWDKHMQNGVVSAYHEINQYLIEKGILPKIKREVRRAGGSSMAEIAAIAAQAAVEAVHAAEGDGDVFATMQQLFSTAAMRGTVPGMGGMASMPAAGAFGVMPASGAMPTAGGTAGVAGSPAAGSSPAPVGAMATPFGHNPVVLTQLTQLQHGDMDAAGAAALTSAGTGMLAPVGILRDIKDSVLGDKLGHADAMTLEVVAMLFDYIFEDKQVPDPIKALIGRLQIPVLKAAMLDQGFFSKRNHPTRRLLNTLAEAATGWDQSVTHESPLYQQVESIVQRILDRFEDDLSVFEEVISDFQQFLDEQERASDALVEAAAPLIVAREKQEIAVEEAREAAEQAVRTRATDIEIPEVVRAFLCDTWTRALSAAYMSEGAEGAPWLEAVGIMDDLIWSVRPKTTRESREQLIKILPTLLRRLKDGMVKADTATSTREQFLSQLVKCHAAAVSAGFHPVEETQNKPETSPTAARGESAVVLQFPKPQVAAQEAVKLEIITAKPEQSQLNMEEITIAGVGWMDEEEFASDEPHTQSQPSEARFEIDEETARDVVAALKPGMWVEFRHQGLEPLQAKLKWISPLKGAYLFADRQGKRAATMPRDKLEAAFRIGTAKLLEEAPLLDRAVDNVIETLKKAAA